MSFVYRAQQPQPPVPPTPTALLFPAGPPPAFPDALFRPPPQPGQCYWLFQTIVPRQVPAPAPIPLASFPVELTGPPPEGTRWQLYQPLYERAAAPPVPIALLFPAAPTFPTELLAQVPAGARYWRFQQLAQRIPLANGMAVYAAAPAPVTVPFDVYAWFPGDRGPGPPTRYEKYAERPRKKKKGPKRTPAAAYVEEIPPLAPFPVAITPPRPVADLDVNRSAVAIPAAPRSAAALRLPQVYPVPGGAEAADWTSYAHLPIDPQEDAEELALLLELGRKRR